MNIFLIFDDVDIDARNKFLRLLEITNMPGIIDYVLKSLILSQKSKKQDFRSGWPKGLSEGVW